MNPNARVIVVEDEEFDAALLAQGLERARELSRLVLGVDAGRGFADPAPPILISLNRNARRRRAALARRQS